MKCNMPSMILKDRTPTASGRIGWNSTLGRFAAARQMPSHPDGRAGRKKELPRVSATNVKFHSRFKNPMWSMWGFSCAAHPAHRHIQAWDISCGYKVPVADGCDYYFIVPQAHPPRATTPLGRIGLRPPISRKSPAIHASERACASTPRAPQSAPIGMMYSRSRPTMPTTAPGDGRGCLPRTPMHSATPIRALNGGASARSGGNTPCT